MKIKWGKYSGFEGPYYLGNIKYILPKLSTLDEKLIGIISATEGNFDSVNMYDRCIVSIGIIQWCEAQYFGVTKLLSDFCKVNGRTAIDNCLVEIIALLGYNPWFQNQDGSFCFVNSNKIPLKSIEEQQEFFLSCSGKIGSWSEAGKNKANLWTKTFASILSIPLMVDFQKTYTIKRAKEYFLNKDVAKILYKDSKQQPVNDIIDAAYLSYMSFSANNPKLARNNFLAAHNLKKEKYGTREWLLAILEQMTHADKIKIYPERYQRISAFLNSVYSNLSLPSKFT